MGRHRQNLLVKFVILKKKGIFCASISSQVILKQRLTSSNEMENSFSVLCIGFLSKNIG